MRRTSSRSAAAALVMALAGAWAHADPLPLGVLDSGDLEAAREALDAGADPNERTITGGTALHYLVAVSSHVGEGELLIVRGAIVQPGRWDITGQQAVAEMLVERGADVNSTSAAGKTPLHVAAAAGHVLAAEFLIAHGANVNAVDDEGHTPLHWARWAGSEEAPRMLHESTGKPVDAQAMRTRAAELAALLERHGAHE